MSTPERPARIDLSWIPLGAGETTGCVRTNGRLYERAVALLERRPPRPLFHSALEVHLDGHRWVVEMTPVWGCSELDRGVVAEGPVGLAPLGHVRLFRYEVRRWRDGRLPDGDQAVGGPRPQRTDRTGAARLLDLVPSVPTPTWGRDELRTGEMWNSNSLVSWLLASSGHDLAGLEPPEGGRAPGWAAGAAVAARQGARSHARRTSGATTASTASPSAAPPSTSRGR